MSDTATPKVRERAVLAVFDHSGPEPVPVEIVELLAVDGRVVSSERREPTAEEITALAIERRGEQDRQMLAKRWLLLVANGEYVQAATLASQNAHIFASAVTSDDIARWATGDATT